jgi:hypothetical protein
MTNLIHPELLQTLFGFTAFLTKYLDICEVLDFWGVPRLYARQRLYARL